MWDRKKKKKKKRKKKEKKKTQTEKIRLADALVRISGVAFASTAPAPTAVHASGLPRMSQRPKLWLFTRQINANNLRGSFGVIDVYLGQALSHGRPCQRYWLRIAVDNPPCD